MDLNKVMIRGRVGADPEIRHTQSGKVVANLSVATSNKSGDKEYTEWHRVTLWGRKAEVAQEYVKKGDLLFIEGSLQTRKWEDKDGVTRYTTEITGFRIDLLGSPSGEGKPKSKPSPKKNDMEIDDTFDDMDDDLPF